MRRSLWTLAVVFGVFQPLYAQHEHPKNAMVPPDRHRMGVETVALSKAYGQVDDHGRIRVSDTYTQFSSWPISGKATLLFAEKVVNTSGQAQSVVVPPTWNFIVGQNDTIIRQTRTHFTYQIGTSQRVFMAAKVDTVPGLKCRVGQFNELDGVFFESLDNVLYCVVRRAGVDQRVAQSNFNQDRLDGTGHSKVSLRLGALQAFIINYVWMGGGEVRFSLLLEGIPVSAHTFYFSNDTPIPYTNSLHLPLRFEATKTGPGIDTVKTAGVSISAEGGWNDSPRIRSFSSNGNALTATNIGTTYVLLAMKLKQGNIGSAVRPGAVSVLTPTNNAGGEWFLAVNPTVAGTLNFVDEPNSPIQVSRGTSANVVTEGSGIGRLQGGMFSGNVTEQELFTSSYALGSQVDSTRTDTLALCVRPIRANTEVYGTIVWKAGW